MMEQRFLRTALAVCVSASLLAACGGGAGKGGSVALPPSAPSTYQQSGFVYDALTVKSAQLVGDANLSTFSLDVVPHLQNADGLMTYARSANDPRSGNYRHFLTPGEIGDRFGASQSDYAAAKTYLTSHHLAVTGWPQRLLLHVAGKQADLEAAFNTKFGVYKSGKQTFIAPEKAPQVPSGVPIIGSPDIVQNLADNVDSVRLNGVSGQGNGILYGYTPQQIAAAFDYNGAYRLGYTGAGITVGIIGTGGYSAADASTYRSMFHIPGSGSVTMVAATDADAPGNGATGFATPPPVTAPCSFGGPITPTASCNPEDGETQLDTEQITGLAYDSAVKYYLAYNPNDGCGIIGQPCPPGTGIALQGLGEVDAEIQTAIADDSEDIISMSFGGPEQGLAGTEFNTSGRGFEPLEFAALASEGIAIFASSGDSGAEACEMPYYAPAADDTCAQYPASDPNVVAVGATTTPVDSSGRLVGPLAGWGLQTSNGWYGSGGGVSAYFQQPPFQTGAAGITGTMRNLPDISLNGDGSTGVSVIIDADPSLGGMIAASFGGTSVAAPESAAMWALVLQACNQTASCRTASGSHPYRLGNPNAFFYKIYGDKTQYATTFSDVLYGDNAQLPSCWKYPWTYVGPTPCPSIDPGYQALKGYDLVTGIGVPYARALIHAVVGV
jgi:kumamolisin